MRAFIGVSVAVWLVGGGLMPAQAQQAAGAQPVAGTHVWLVPPAGFTPAPGLTGLRSGAAVLQVFDGQGGNYYRQAGSFTATRFAARGGQVLELQDVSAGSYPGRLARVRQSGTQETTQVLFGDSTFAVLLEARYPASDTATATALRRSMLGARYQKNADSNSQSATIFQFDEDKTPFQFAQAEAGTLYYTPKGQPRAENTPTVAVRLADYNLGITLADISQQMLQRYPALRGYTVRKLSSAKVNDLLTYETEGFAQLNGQRVLVYQQVSVIGNTAVSMVGIAQAEVENTLTQFKDLTHTITPKRRKP
ncbi:hypothetical protein HER32_03885 [Hymenobacter sp. BT18]|uniref:hypothetical protein n=1 Tax=Hymenobacter sp. BT18 TaxID=2835648 RepID=UPI00143E9A8C|nr:hypothetical protein [Hymenobacter sp. BT18]QIX60373.1 hypothetical protein HER32_03885 [Hymenobacter sp. BT18]